MTLHPPVPDPRDPLVKWIEGLVVVIVLVLLAWGLTKAC